MSKVLIVGHDDESTLPIIQSIKKLQDKVSLIITDNKENNKQKQFGRIDSFRFIENPIKQESDMLEILRRMLGMHGNHPMPHMNFTRNDPRPQPRRVNAKKAWKMRNKTKR